MARSPALVWLPASLAARGFDKRLVPGIACDVHGRGAHPSPSPQSTCPVVEPSGSRLPGVYAPTQGKTTQMAFLRFSRRAWMDAPFQGQVG